MLGSPSRMDAAAAVAFPGRDGNEARAADGCQRLMQIQMIGVVLMVMS